MRPGERPSLWLRREAGPTELRAPIAPAAARALIAAGIAVTVEDCPRRIFRTEEYAAAGCRIAGPGTWPDAPDDHYVIGLKEPEDDPLPLRHRHLFFGHAYNGQRGAGRLLRRFAEGGGSLLDLEHVTDAAGVRVAAFGHWAGYVGAALAVLHAGGLLDAPLRPMSLPALEAALRRPRERVATALVIGALGRG
ncbi:saccharopine dehydrogenase, partial [Spongiactinospora gelatinilytica]